MTELQATINGLYKQWTDGLRDMTTIIDPKLKREQAQYLKDLHVYATELKKQYSEVKGQEIVKLNLIVKRPVDQYLIQTKKNTIVVR